MAFVISAQPTPLYLTNYCFLGSTLLPLAHWWTCHFSTSWSEHFLLLYKVSSSPPTPPTFEMFCFIKFWVCDLYLPGPVGAELAFQLYILNMTTLFLSFFISLSLFLCNSIAFFTLPVFHVIHHWVRQLQQETIHVGPYRFSICSSD